MTKQEYLDVIMHYPVNEERTKSVSELFGSDIRGIFARIVSFADNADFIGEERRAFSYNEIVNSAKEYNKDFIALGIIPFIDAYDNDLIVYVLEDKSWAKYSLSDDIIFKKKDTLDKVL
ncbi:MAG: hypothetical protein IKH78_04655 [Ruminococcus sp.]|nr:hypothetical protein [Ruminococcus sp.]